MMLLRVMCLMKKNKYQESPFIIIRTKEDLLECYGEYLKKQGMKQYLIHCIFQKNKKSIYEGRR